MEQPFVKEPEITEEKQNVEENKVISELLLGGASHRGISYIGALKCLEDHNILKKENLKKIIGVSIGAFVSTCYIIGYNLDELLDHVLDMNIPSFMDFSFSDISIIKGDAFRKWIKETIARKVNPDITFKELHNISKIDFIVHVTCLDEGLILMSHENYPDMKIFDAICASTCFPFVFSPYEIGNKSYIDGGMICNFPVYKMGEAAICLKSSRKIISSIKNYSKINKLDSISNTFSYMYKLYNITTAHIAKLNEHLIKKVIILDIPVSDSNVIDFNIDMDDKITLYKEGYNYVAGKMEELKKYATNPI